ncbi:MAG: hypothetical protein RIT81_45650 [Deltaproteobacteria bacterium]
MSRSTRELLAGRILVYFPDADLADGAAEQASGGFLDAFNCPPFGTWIGYFEQEVEEEDKSYASYLLAWTPKECVRAAATGIDVNPERCIQWLRDTDIPIAYDFDPLELDFDIT